LPPVSNYSEEVAATGLIISPKFHRQPPC
jgi:hypothetical protein